ncbi:heat shock factor protein 1-like, partial [Cyanistes caeruleus]|uniref:heat shock factor protein 1-like n=1 Tax=Cyanistes caeruleus TaxID=156563 RepID=UPI000CDB57F0
APPPALGVPGRFPADPGGSGPRIADVTELPPSSPEGSPGHSPGHSPPIRIKEEPPSPTRSPRPEEPRNSGNSGNSGNSETPLSPSTFIDSILRENDSGAAPGNPQSQEKCLSLACLDKAELSEHLDTIDSGLENLQALLSTHGFSMDSALLDLFSPSVAVPDVTLPDLDSSLASVSSEFRGNSGEKFREFQEKNLGIPGKKKNPRPHGGKIPDFPWKILGIPQEFDPKSQPGSGFSMENLRGIFLGWIFPVEFRDFGVFWE